jgi:hypothetical protein
MAAIYVETTIRTTLDELWRLTQTPELHARWDLRFTDIRYLPRADESHPQRFLYETRIGFGLRIRGEGETVSSRESPSGARASALKFWSDDPRSLIRQGSGYWRYEPVAGGIRFLTRYDYEPRLGLLGRAVDYVAFRPLLGWATAWSFDRLRLWAEDGIDPAVSLERSVTHAIARLTLVGVWLYQGVVPKLLFPDTGELAILRGAGVLGGAEPVVLRLVGVGEVAWSLLLLVHPLTRAPLWVTLALLVALTLAALVSAPATLVAPFNPPTLNTALAGLCAVALVVGRRLPSAMRCRRRPQARQRGAGRRLAEPGRDSSPCSG